MSTHPVLRDALGDDLALRRAVGFKLASAGRLLGQFVDYLNEHAVGTPTTDDALAWANLPASASGNWRGMPGAKETPCRRCPGVLKAAEPNRFRRPIEQPRNGIPMKRHG